MQTIVPKRDRRHPANIERELHNLVHRFCPLKVKITTIKLTVVDYHAANAVYRAKKKKRWAKKRPPPIVKQVDWPVQTP